MICMDKIGCLLRFGCENYFFQYLIFEIIMSPRSKSVPPERNQTHFYTMIFDICWNQGVIRAFLSVLVQLWFYDFRGCFPDQEFQGSSVILLLIEHPVLTILLMFSVIRLCKRIKYLYFD